MNRGQLRLSFARDILKLPINADVMAHIETLPKVEVDRLRGLVDWVEEYHSTDVKFEVKT